MTKHTSDLFVRGARSLMSMTQEELGKYLGKSRFTIARYETGERLPESVKLAILHLMTEHGIDAETRHVCLHLPNPGRHKVVPNSVRAMRERISRYKRTVRKYNENHSK